MGQTGMPLTARHQCLIYKGSPAIHLPGLSRLMRQKLSENYRCLYLDSTDMIDALRPYLSAAGIDVPKEVGKGSLLLSSESAHLKEGHFNADRMLRLLEDALTQSQEDGYAGLWCTGDMTMEFGPKRDFSQLLDYEWRLEEFLQTHPTLSGICQYHADSLPHEALRQGLLGHSSLYINETLSRLNPYHVERTSFTAESYNHPALDQTIRELCLVPDALIVNALPPGYLQ